MCERMVPSLSLNKKANLKYSSLISKELFSNDWWPARFFFSLIQSLWGGLSCRGMGELADAECACLRS